MKKLLVVLTFLCIFTSPVSFTELSFQPTMASAEEVARELEYESFTSFPGVGRISTLCELTDALWQLGIIVLITSVFGVIVYAGFEYVTAGVNVNGVSEAKQRFMSAITGLILGLSSVLILGVLNVDLLRPTCTLQFVGAGTNAFDNFAFGGASSSNSGGGATGDVPPAGTPCDDNSGLQCLEPGSASTVVITSCYLRNSSPYPGAYHGGTDWVVVDGSPGNVGSPVAALTAGVVADVCRGGCGGFGNTVTLRGPSLDGYDLYNYSHLQSIAPGIEPGVQVGQGTILGGQGGTPNYPVHVDTKISNCLLCKAAGSQYTKPTLALRPLIEQVYGVSTSCNCRNGCNDT